MTEKNMIYGESAANKAKHEHKLKVGDLCIGKYHMISTWDGEQWLEQKPYQTVVKLEVGDEIEVMGHRFILVEVSSSMNNPAKVVFKQPLEIMPLGKE